MTRRALLVALVACGGNKDAAPKVAITDADLAAVTAAVPADLTDKLVFEIGTIESKKGREPDVYKLVRPKGWIKGFMPGELKPADAGNFGSPTLGKSEMRIDSNCDGKCEKKDWAAVADKVHFARFGKSQGKIVKDVKGTNERTLVFEHTVSEAFQDNSVAFTIVRAWWDPDGSRYFTCTVELGTQIKGAADAFEKACSKVSGD